MKLRCFLYSHFLRSKFLSFHLDCCIILGSVFSILSVSVSFQAKPLSMKRESEIYFRIMYSR